MPQEERKELIRRIQDRRGSTVICCLTSDRNNAQGRIAKDFIPRFFGHLRGKGGLPKLDIFLFTLGGDTLAAYALGKFVREFSELIGVLVPHWCHSAGTLFALGADEIVMTDVGTLSAIDPSITGNLNPQIEGAGGAKQTVPVGVESVAGFRSAVYEDWRLNDEGTSAAFRLLCERVNPLLIGDLYRSREQIIRLSTNLMNLHNTDADRTRSIAKTLATGLGSHDYLIGRDEARNDLKLPVLDRDDELEQMIWELYEDFAKEMMLGCAFDANMELYAAQKKGTKMPFESTQRFVVIESLERSDVWDRVLLLQVNQSQVVFNDWR